METNTQNTHLIDHLPIKKTPLREIRQPVKRQESFHQKPFHEKRQTKLLVLIGCLIVVIVFISVSAGLYFGSPTSSITSSPAPAQNVSQIPASIFSVPDLTSLIKLLNSRDPDIQELALSPKVRVGPSGTPGFLPSGSRVEVKPETWKVINVDANNEPLVAWIQALVTSPGDKNPQNYDLHLVKEKGQWLLYNTTKR